MFRDIRVQSPGVQSDQLRLTTGFSRAPECLKSVYSVKLDTFVLIHMAAVSEFKNLHHVIIMTRDLAKSDYR